jgi:hypothetical protein
MLTREDVESIMRWAKQQERDSATIERPCREYIELARVWLERQDWLDEQEEPALEEDTAERTLASTD